MPTVIENPPPRPSGAKRWNNRLATVLFFAYLLLYGSFVAVNAFAPDWMQHRPWGGLNWALLSGFGLIAAAILAALVYGVGSRTAMETPSEEVRR